MMKILNKIIKSKTLYGGIILISFWYIAHIIINSSTVPGPFETFTAFIRLIGEDMLIHIGASMLRIFAAVAISIIIGVPLGLWIGFSLKADAILSPILYLLYPIPKVAFLPVFFLLFGLGNTSKIILIITIIILQIIIATRDGIKEIPMELIYSVKSLGLKTFGMYKHLILPAALSKIISSLRISVGISISVLFFTENYGTFYGIGYFIMYQWSILRYAELFAGIIGFSLMGFFMFRVIDLVEKKLCPWIFIQK